MSVNIQKCELVDSESLLMSKLGFRYFISLPLNIADEERAPSSKYKIKSNYPTCLINIHRVYMNRKFIHEKLNLNKPYIWFIDKQEMFNIVNTKKIVNKLKDINVKFGISFVFKDNHGEKNLFTAASCKSTETGLEFQNLTYISPNIVFNLIDMFVENWNHQSEPKNKNGSSRQFLSVKEVECLFWTAKGKTSWEISQIIGRSEATVNFHIRKSTQKLGASNRCETVAMAVERGLIMLDSAHP